MTVKELKQALNQFPDDAQVYSGVHRGTVLYAVSGAGMLVRLNFEAPTRVIKQR